MNSRRFVIRLDFQISMSAKRLVWYVGSAILIYLLGIFVVKPLLPPSSQEVHMKQVKEHIEKIAPAWNVFKGTNSGFELVKFRVYTGGDGLFGIVGLVTSEGQKESVIHFVTETDPPRALFTNALQVVAPDYFQAALEFELGGKTNRSN